MMKPNRILSAWGKILTGRVPILSIEVTRECPLACPGCYAYGDNHLGGGVTLRQLSDLRGDALVEGVIRQVERHSPLQVSLVGGEPLVRHRELSRILPILSQKGVFTMVVTSGVIPIPVEWMDIPKAKIVVSVDGLPAEHDVRRKPATYERILRNIEGRRVDISWVITQPMMQRPGYLEEYLDFWTRRSEINRIGLSIYTPQLGERSPEMLTPKARQDLIGQLPELKRCYPALSMSDGMAAAFATPPSSPQECTFSQLSVNYTADLKSRVEPCVFGGTPDCTQCGCAATAAFHWIGNLRFGPLKISQMMKASIAVGSWVNQMRPSLSEGLRWNGAKESEKTPSSSTQT
ncbi:MAG: radical SAM protein [Acidobacteriota bacterium]